MSLRGLLIVGSLGLPLFAQIVDSSSAYYWVSNIGGLGIAAILALRTVPEERKAFTEALREERRAFAGVLERNTEALTALRLHLAGKENRESPSRFI